MNLYQEIMKIYPELDSELFADGTIVLQDDSDGAGAYISAWKHSKPLPKGMKIGK